MSGDPDDAGPPPVPKWVGAAALVAGLAASEPVLEHTLVPDGEIGSTVLRVLLLVFDLAAVAFGLWVLLRRPRSRIPWNRLALAAGGAVLAWFLAFAVLDTRAPELLRGSGIRYFEIRGRYAPDSTLVMVPRRTGHRERYRFRGDLHDPDDDIPDPALDYRSSYNELGFRANSSQPPHDVVVLGDSFVEFGETDSTTVSELIREATGLSTFNLGRGWYGPGQYAALLGRHVVDLDPDYAVVFFFEGNDAEDARQYRAWRDGGSYHHFSRVQGALWSRFATATYDLVSFVQWELARALGFRRRLADLLGRDEAQTPHNTGRVAVGGDTLRMRFGYWPTGSGRSVEELADTARWRSARRALRRLRDTALAHGVTPIVVFLPTKATAYDRRIVAPPPRFRSRELDAAGKHPVRARVLAGIAEDLNLIHVDLTGRFRERAADRPLLYYRQDTHWTPAGRRLAAEAVAATLGNH